MLSTIRSPKDLKTINPEQLPQLCANIRENLIQKISTCGGHLSSNLGIVELTTALHYVFDAPTDKIVFDVSHQTYVHKMLPDVPTLLFSLNITPKLTVSATQVKALMTYSPWVILQRHCH